MHFGDAEYNADNDLSMGNMQYVLPEREYMSMYSDLRVLPDGDISYICIQYELWYPNFESMYFFPGNTTENRVYDEYEETEVNGIPAAYVYKEALVHRNQLLLPKGNLRIYMKKWDIIRLAGSRIFKNERMDLVFYEKNKRRKHLRC